MRNYHRFDAVQVEPNGALSTIDSFRVTKRRHRDTAYDMAEAKCEQARSLPHKPAAYVREVNAPGEAAAKPTTDIVIYISGGVVTGVSTNVATSGAVRVAVVDYDNGKGIAPEDRDAYGVHQFDDGTASVGVEIPTIDPEAVADVMKKADA